MFSDPYLLLEFLLLSIMGHISFHILHKYFIFPYALTWLLYVCSLYFEKILFLIINILLQKVGDPVQLPATVISPIAERFG